VFGEARKSLCHQDGCVHIGMCGGMVNTEALVHNGVVLGDKEGEGVGMRVGEGVDVDGGRVYSRVACPGLNC